MGTREILFRVGASLDAVAYSQSNTFMLVFFLSGFRPLCSPLAPRRRSRLGGSASRVFTGVCLGQVAWRRRQAGKICYLISSTLRGPARPWWGASAPADWLAQATQARHLGSSNIFAQFGRIVSYDSPSYACTKCVYAISSQSWTTYDSP